MERLIPIEAETDIPPGYRRSPVGELLRYHQLGVPLRPVPEPRLLVGMCMDHRKRLRIPEGFAYVLRSGGGNLRPSEFKVSFAIAIGGVRSIALIAHSHCGMVHLMSRRDDFVEGLVEGAGWDREWAEQHFLHFAPLFEIGHEIDFVLAEAQRLRLRYPRVEVAPLYYRVEDGSLSCLREEPRDAGPG